MATVKRNFIPDEEFNRDSAEWMELTAKIAADKTREIELRNKLISKVFKNGIVPVGTTNVVLPEGWVLKAQGKVNISVDESLVGETKALIEQQVKDGKLTPFVFDDVVRYKPQVSMSEFNALTAEQKHALRNCLSEKPGQAAIEITKPKRAIR